MKGWYLGRAPDHYRNYNCYIPSTRGGCTAAKVSFFPQDFAVPTNSHKGDVARALRDLTAALQHRCHQTPLQNIGDEQMLAIKQLERILCPTLQQPTTLPPTEIPVLSPAPSPALNQAMCEPEPSQFALEPSQVPAPTDKRSTEPFSQDSVPVSLSPLNQDTQKDNPKPTHCYPTRFAISQDDFSLGCATKSVHASNFLAAQPAPCVHFSEHFAAPVIDPVTGQSLEYRHLMKGPNRSIWVRSLTNDLGRLAQGVGTRIPTGNNTIFFVHPSEIPLHKKSYLWPAGC